jgi:hypothetical protein
MKGQTQQFSANVTAVGGASTAVTWSIVESHNAGTSISTSGLLTIAAAEAATTLTVRATSNFNSAISGNATVTVTNAPVTPEVLSVAVNPLSVTLEKGQWTQFTANVTAVGGASTDVTWSIVESHNAGTTIDASGILTIAAAESATTLTVRATSNFNSAIFGNATVTITDAPVTPEVLSVAVNPSYKEMAPGDNFNFEAYVTAVGGASQDVEWTILGNTSPNTKIYGNGFFEIDESEPNGTITIRATSTFDISKYGEATVLISTTGIEDLMLQNISVYPNPCVDELRIDSEINGLQFTIYDLQGKSIINTNSSVINVTSLTSGVYVLKINTERGERTVKVIKK